jgi:hypothetical protein
MTLTRIGIIGDVHGEDVRLENALRFLEPQTEKSFAPAMSWTARAM